MSKNITPSNYSYEDDRVSAFFGLLLFIVTLGALYMVCINFANQPSTPSPLGYQSKSEQKNEFLLSKGAEESFPTTAERTFVNAPTSSLTYEGYTEVGEPITFSIQHFSPEAKYRIDFGNGRIQEVKQQDVVYAYDNPSKYQVKVQMEYAGQIKTISKKTIEIFPAIEMKASIAEVEF